MADIPAKADLVYGNPNPSAAVFGAALGLQWDFIVAALGSKVNRAALPIVAATTLGVADNQKKARCTGGTTYTVDFSAAATLGDGWLVFLRNDGTVPVTLEPNGAELIDGLSNLQIHPGAAGLVYCDGSNLYTLGLRNVVSPQGQCRLTKSGSNLLLSRYQGRFITINGVNYEIPSAGVTCVPTSNTANTTYYIYAHISGGAIALEYSITGHSAHTDGTEIKTGSGGTHVLVGMWRSGTSGGTWSSIATEGRSWFNRGSIAAETVLGASITTGTNGSAVELSSAFRAGFLCWGDDAVEVTLDLNVGNSSTSNYTYFVIGIDSSATGSGKYNPQQDYDTTNVAYDRKCYWKGSLAEGYHDARCLGFQTSAATLTVGGGAGIQGSRFNVSIEGA